MGTVSVRLGSNEQKTQPLCPIKRVHFSSIVRNPEGNPGLHMLDHWVTLVIAIDPNAQSWVSFYFAEQLASPLLPTTLSLLFLTHPGPRDAGLWDHLG